MFNKFLNRLRLKRELNDQFESGWLRNYFKEQYAIEVGLYSYGCFDPVRIPRKTRIGRYCSFSSTCYFLNGNHGLDFISLHPYLYNVTLGMVKQETIVRTNFIVEDDVWVGHNAIILPSVNKIGRGAVIAAGAVVTKDVRPYEIVGSNPAKHIKFRFDEKVIERIEATQWWLLSKSELAERIKNEPDLIYSPKSYFNE